MCSRMPSNLHNSEKRLTSTFTSKACCLCIPSQIWDTTSTPLPFSNLLLMILLSSHTISRHLALCSFPPSDPCNGTICAFPYLPLGNTHTFRQLLHPRSANDPRPCLRSMPCRPAVIGISFEQGFDRFEPLLLSILQYHASWPILPMNVFGKKYQCLFDVFWARTLHTNHSAISILRTSQPSTAFSCLCHASLTSSSLFPGTRCCTRQFMLEFQIVDLQEERERD